MKSDKEYLTNDEKLQWEQQMLGQVINILNDPNNDYDRIIIFGAEYLSPEMKKVLGIKNED